MSKSSGQTAKVVVIGSGRFGTAVAQGLRESFIKTNDKTLIQISVLHVSARKFTCLAVSEMADKLIGASYVAYCGTKLQKYASTIANAMKESQSQTDKMQSKQRESCPEEKFEDGLPLEFIDFSNPDPVYENHDVGGALHLWNELMVEDGAPVKWKLWKITGVGSLDVGDAENSSSDALVYGNGISRGEVPRLMMPGVVWKTAPCAKYDLVGEAHTRMMERASIDRWYDAALMGFAMFCFTGMYTILRYHENVNGKVPDSNVVMYLLNKAYAWTGLWMMVISPFAGNLLALGSLYGKFGSLPFFQKLVTLFCSICMVIPCVFISVTMLLWIIYRNIFFYWTRGAGTTSRLYQTQPGNISGLKRLSFWKSCLIDLITNKNETGNVGFVHALIHSFIGFIVCDVAYKTYWFGPTGRLLWRFELSMMTGCASTAILWCVAMRSLIGKTSWFSLKPLYSYLSPLGIWLATLHVMAYGAKGWTTLFKKEFHNGQMSITFVSSMFPFCVLFVHHLMAIFGTKKIVSDSHLWRNSLINIANQDFLQMTSRLQISSGGYSKGWAVDNKVKGVYKLAKIHVLE